MLFLGGWSNLRRGSLLAVATAVGLAGACGGTAVIDSSGGTAGTTSVAGATSVAGSSATAGAAGSAALACTAPQEFGECEAYIPSFWHDPATGLCEPFVYGGCGGNANRYPSREACQEACANIQDDWDECVEDSDCSIVGQRCCGDCEPLRVERVIAINISHKSQYETCTVPTSCAPCEPVAENEQAQKYFKPKCQSAHCTIVDIRETPLTACEKTSDCMLRDGAGCCAECDGAGWVAVNKNADLCGGVQLPCDECLSPLPKEWDVVCLSGRCRQEGPL
jgi:hypothetical protein